MVWMVDAYTYSNRYPYSEPLGNSGVNYIRNSVKITVDAYDGETNFYIVDNQDPIINTYQNIYPDLFQSFIKMPQDIKEHMKYPKDLFWYQAMQYRIYHMLDPRVFYNKEDLWSIPSEKYEESTKLMMPYYMVTKLPNEEKESFILMLPFTPKNKNNMISWLSAKCDVDEYGKLKIFYFLKSELFMDRCKLNHVLIKILKFQKI